MRFLYLSLLLLCSSTAVAEVFLLKNGKVIEGEYYSHFSGRMKVVTKAGLAEVSILDLSPPSAFRFQQLIANPPTTTSPHVGKVRVAWSKDVKTTRDPRPTRGQLNEYHGVQQEVTYQVRLSNIGTVVLNKCTVRIEVNVETINATYGSQRSKNVATFDKEFIVDNLAPSETRVVGTSRVLLEDRTMQRDVDNKASTQTLMSSKRESKIKSINIVVLDESGLLITISR